MKFVHLLAALFVSAPLVTAPLALAETAGEAASATASAKTFDFPEEGETLRTVTMEEMKEMVKSHDSELLVVNFWATWCAPCVAELPYFAEADKEFRDKGVRIVGLSLDNFTYEGEWQNISAATMKERGVRYANFGVDADTDKFVPWFAEEWAGAIPATFYFDKNGNKVGHRLRDVTKEELFSDIEKYLPKETAAETDGQAQSSNTTEKS